MARLRRRHPLPGILRFDPAHQRTIARIPADYGRAKFLVRSEGKLGAIEPQAGLASARIGSVTGVAILRKDWLDRLIERQLSGWAG